MATLKELVNEVTTIKNELKTYHINLKNNLIEKSVECSDTDKIQNLIDRVGGIKTVAKVTASDNVIASHPISSSVTPSNPSTFYDYISLKAMFEGSIRIVMETYSNYASAKAVIIINIIRNNEVVYTTGEMQGGTSSGLTLSNDISDIKYGDIINVKLGTNYPNKTVTISKFCIGGDLV